jgi:ketosteroid isomerase-like protein
VSEENVERLRAAYERFNVDKQFDATLLTADVEFATWDGVQSGRDGVARGIRLLTDIFDDYRAEPEEFVLAGAQIVVFVRLTGRARVSGVPVEGRVAHVFRFRGKQVDRWHTYADRHDALKAVGLEE